MRCARLDHFVRFNPNGTVSRCGHMVDAPEFGSLTEMENSSWLANVKELMKLDQWPAECVRCQEIERESPSSVRIHALALDALETQPDYLQVAGVLDNVCNAGCLTCSPQCSTRIGALESRTFSIVDNSNRFWELPQECIRHLDINGGEPSYSKNYRRLLENLPPNLKTLRINTNGATVIQDLVYIAGCGVDVTVTLSCDGIGSVFELVRWPITWAEFYRNLKIYQCLPVKLNLWTTVSILNLHDLPNIRAFAQEHGIDHGYAYLKEPKELDVNNKNTEEVEAYILKQKQLRGML
jgi:molybdenum cofactor biosynthesis enzyme MoaA